MCRYEAPGVAIIAIDTTKFGIADSYGLLQHRRKHRLKIAGKAADNLQHFRGGGLLIQRFCKLPSALLLCLEQSGVLDRDHRLVGEGLGQLDLLVRKRTYGRTLQEEYANRSPLSQKRYAQACAKVAESCELKVDIFRIIKDIRNLHGFAF